MQIKKIAFDAGSGYAEGEYGTTEVSVDAENMIKNIYVDLLRTLKGKLKRPTEEERAVLHKSLTSFILELSNIYKNSDGEDQKEIGDILVKYQQVLKESFGGKMADISLEEVQQAENPKDEQGGGGGGMPSMAKRNTFIVTAQGVKELELDNDLVNDLLSHYAEKASRVLGNKLPIYDIEYDDDFAIMNLYMEDKDEPCISIRINDLMHIDSIMPVGELNSVCPFHSVYFYQKYWKPIVDSIGHFFLDDCDSLILSKKNELPDTPSENEDVCLECWDITKKDYSVVDISFRNKKDMTWFFGSGSKQAKKANGSNGVIKKYAEQEYINAIVKCIDPSLPSLYERMGRVLEILPRDEISVLFFTPQQQERVTKEKETINENNTVVRLTRDQLEVLDDVEIAASF